MSQQRPLVSSWMLAVGIALVAPIELPARAESALTLPTPGITGNIDAHTYDESGQRVGDASIAFDELDSGNFLLVGRSGIEGSARTEVRAEFVPVENDRLRLVYQQTQAHDESGQSLGVMSIDHRKGVAMCGAPPGSGKKSVEVKLPEQDRVVNVPLNLLFQPLVKGEVEQIRFQVLLCRVGARLVNAKARVTESPERDEPGLIEVRYSLDFGPLLSKLAAPFMPRLSFWFQDSSPGNWIGHRMPLFSKGPTVLVVRSGFAPTVFGTAGQ